MEAPRLFVVKKDGRREQYNRDKILSGLRRACEKRPISESQMEAVAADLERELFARGESEVRSTLVGEKLMEALKTPRPGRLHPLRQRLPLVPRRRELPGRIGGSCLPSDRRWTARAGRVQASARRRRSAAAGVHERARRGRRPLRRRRRRRSTLAPGERALVPTGFAIALPTGYEAQVRPRSGLAIAQRRDVLELRRARSMPTTAGRSASMLRESRQRTGRRFAAATASRR